MRLDRTHLLPYLLGRSWIDADAVIAGDAVVVERRLRHTSFVVEQKSGRGVFVKQLHDPHPEAAASLRREAAFYAALAAGRLPGLAPYVPTLVGFEPREHILALDRFDGLSAQDRAVAGRPLGPAEASELGAALARVHRIAADDARVTLPGLLDESLPWAFHLAQFLATHPSSIPGAGLAMLDLMRAHPQLVEWVASLASWWRRRCLVHADLKWENVLLAADDAEGSSDVGHRIRLVDWELAAVGDPAWDVATVLQAFLVRTCLERAREQPLARSELAHHHPTLHSFLGAWARGSGLHGSGLHGSGLHGSGSGDLGPELPRILAFTAARTIYSAYEHATVSPAIHPALVAMVSTAWQMLGDARHAAQLLGIDP